jgi:hypothetical protein
MIVVKNIIIFLDADELYACKELNMMWMRKLNEVDAWMIQSKHAVVCKKIKI